MLSRLTDTLTPQQRHGSVAFENDEMLLLVGHQKEQPELIKHARGIWTMFYGVPRHGCTDRMDKGVPHAKPTGPQKSEAAWLRDRRDSVAAGMRAARLAAARRPAGNAPAAGVAVAAGPAQAGAWGEGHAREQVRLHIL